MREAWIKSKYIDKSFVKDINVHQILSPPNAGGRTWSVRKVRRRTQKERHLMKSTKALDEDDSDKSEKSVVVFGDDIPEPILEGPLFVSSDEDSATSEDGK